MSVLTSRPSARRAGRTAHDWRSLLRLVITAGAVASSLGALLNFVIGPLAGAFTGRFEDFAAYAQAAHSVAAGASPYASFDPSTIVMSGFDYPPFAAVLLRPLAALPPHWEQIVWLWVALGALVGGAVITARALLPAAWPRARLGVLVGLTFPPATYNLWHGQMNTVIFLLLAMALSDYLSGHRTRCGMILGIAAGIKIAPVILLLVLIRRGWWRGAAAGIATGAATLATGLVALGWPVTRHYLTSVLPVLNRDNGWIYNQTWNGVVNRLAQHSVLTVDPPSPWPHLVATALSVATLGVLLVAVSRSPRSRAQRGAEFACGVVAMLLVGTVTWYPVYVHLLVALAATAGLAYERGVGGRVLAGWTAAVLIGVGAVAGTVIATLSIQSIAGIAAGPLWWVFLQACSLPALLAAALLLVMARALGKGAPATVPLRVAARAL